jgi:opacity protein-like surface antigen
MRHVGLLVGLAALVTATSAAASGDPLGFYIGAAGGRSDIRVTEPVSELGRDAHPTGWTIFAGLRPLSFIGAELEYIDFGHSTAQSFEAGLPDLGPFSESLEWHQRATALFANLYAPIPSSRFDIYAKAGAAHLETTGNASISPSCGFILRCPTPSPSTIHISDTDIRFAYGAGAQLKVSAVAIRVEYQRIAASVRDPDLLSVGLSFMF